MIDPATIILTLAAIVLVLIGTAAMVLNEWLIAMFTFFVAVGFLELA